jgi:acylaminoacyl-peptidase
LAFYATTERFTRWTVKLEGSGSLRLYVDGAARGAEGAFDADASSLETEIEWARGMHRVLVRVERAAGADASFTVTLRTDLDAAALVFDTEPAHPVAHYDELRALTVPTGLRLSPDGELLAFARRERDRTGEGGLRQMDVIDVVSGRTVAGGLGGAGATAVAWRTDARKLLFRNGGDLFVWDRSTGAVARVLHDEPGLGPVAWSPDGTFLVFASSHGVADPAEGNVRRVELREKLSDWPTGPHLHLLMLESGVRRRLTAPGDHVQDAFGILPDNRTLVYLRNLPMDERPWFFTQFRKLDLVSGADTLFGSVVMGFENRPGLFGFALSPDGEKLAFVGPPSELGSHATKEPNAFDPDLFVMHVEDGSWYRLTEDLDPAVVGTVAWSADSQSVRFEATEGSRHRIVRIALRDAADPFATRIDAAGGDRIHALSLDANGDHAAVVSDTDRLPVVMTGSAGRRPREILDPNAALRERWRLATPVDASFTGPDGSRIEGWLYRPPGRRKKTDAKLPLIVYYYGGATPTLRGFNELHQFLVANGYALFVLNPRGANGYGEAFADLHVAEQGELASADVLAGIDALLATNSDLDPERIGCYGGSYGGFMTMTLIARSDRFAAAVSLYGISNVASYFGDGMWGYTYGDQAINRYPWADPQFFVDHSPLFSADKVDTPLLLLHGDEDGNVPPNESEQMFTALRLLNRPVELVRFPGEDHGLRGTWANRVEHRTMLLEWFDRWLLGQPEAWESRWSD